MIKNIPDDLGYAHCCDFIVNLINKTFHRVSVGVVCESTPSHNVRRMVVMFSSRVKNPSVHVFFLN